MTPANYVYHLWLSGITVALIAGLIVFWFRRKLS